MKSIQELRALGAAWRTECAKGVRCALVTIVETSGSTFRRVGAAMLVREDGSIVNALSGGCPQRDLVERAKGVIGSGALQYVAYNADHGLDLLMEMGCGGTLEVVIEPLGDDAAAVSEAIDHAVASRRPFTVTTRFPPADAGGPVVREFSISRDASAPPRNRAICSTTPEGFQLLEEYFLPPIRLVVAGAGPEAVELALAASRMGWHGAIVDAAAERLEGVALPREGWSHCVAQPHDLVAATGIDAGTAFVSMTHNLERDIGYLRAASAGKAFYLGALGSRERARAMGDAVKSRALHVPAGLDVGSNTSAEIALAVVAEVMAFRNRRDGRALRRLDGPIHG